MTDIYALTLRAPDGRELRTLAWFPTTAVRQDFYNKAAKRGLEITEHNINPLNKSNDGNKNSRFELHRDESHL